MRQLIKVWIYLTISATCFCYGGESSLNSLLTIEEVLEYETHRIYTALPNDFETLSDAYISRGEGLLISGKYLESLQDLKKGYELAFNCNEDKKIELQMRALFSLLINYGYFEQIDEMYKIESEIHLLLELCKCCDFEEDGETKTFFRSHSLPACIFKTSGKVPRLPGPDKIPIRECLDRVDGTEDALKLLAVPLRGDIQAIANIIIKGLADAARRCCHQGGLWKGCLGPIISKWQKWNMFGIPADPAWD